MKTNNESISYFETNASCTREQMAQMFGTKRLPPVSAPTITKVNEGRDRWMVELPGGKVRNFWTAAAANRFVRGLS